MDKNVNSSFDSGAQVDSIFKKNRYFVITVKKLPPEDFELQIIKSFIDPILDCNYLLYQFISTSSATKYHIKFIFNLSFNQHIIPLLNKLNILNRKNRQKLLIYSFPHKILNQI